MSVTSMTTVDRLRQAIADTLSIDAQGLQAAIGQLMVATSAEYPAAGPEDRSLYSSAVRTTVLLADRIPAGQEAQALAQEIERHHGRQAAQAVLGERVSELLGGDGEVQGNVSVPIEQPQQTGEKLVRAVSDADLLAEINRRGMLQPLYGAIGAVHDHLDRTGALDERLTQYLAYRLRREEAAITGMPDSAARVANWQECIDQLDREPLKVAHDSPSPGM